jgi:hypothetical protein
MNLQLMVILCHFVGNMMISGFWGFPKISDKPTCLGLCWIILQLQNLISQELYLLTTLQFPDH